MVKRFSSSIALALVATLVAASATLAWHVDTGKHQQSVVDPRVIARKHGPAGDPFYRVVVQVTQPRLGACEGWVEVPDANWVGDYRLILRDTGNITIERGERVTLPAGSYVGDWVSPTKGVYEREVERFDIRCKRASLLPAQHTYEVRWAGKGRNGRFVQKATLEPGCTYKSPWKWLRGNTKSKVRVNGERVLQFRTAAPGYYGRLYKGFTPGVSCVKGDDR